MQPRSLLSFTLGLNTHTRLNFCSVLYTSGCPSMESHSPPAWPKPARRNLLSRASVFRNLLLPQCLITASLALKVIFGSPSDQLLFISPLVPNSGKKTPAQRARFTELNLRQLLPSLQSCSKPPITLAPKLILQTRPLSYRAKISSMDRKKRRTFDYLILKII